LAREDTADTLDEVKANLAIEAENGDFNVNISFGKGKPEDVPEYLPARYLILSAKVVGWYLDYFEDIDKMGVNLLTLHPKAQDGEFIARVGYVNDDGKIVPLSFAWENWQEGGNYFSTFGNTPMTFEEYLNNRINKEVEFNIALWNSEGPEFESCVEIMSFPCSRLELEFTDFDEIITSDDGYYKYFSNPEVQQLIAGQNVDVFPNEVQELFVGDITEDFRNLPKFIEWAKAQGLISIDTELVIQFMRAFE